MEIQTPQDIFAKIDLLKSIISDLQKNLSESIPNEELKSVYESASILSTNIHQLSTALEETLVERDSLRTLANIGGAINSSLDTNEVLRIVIDTIIELTGAERCVMMMENDQKEYEVRIGRNWKQQTLTPQEEAISRTIVNRVIETKSPILTTNAQEDPRFDKEASIVDYKLRSIMCVPLEVMGNISGVIYVDNRSIPEKFNQSMLSLLDAFANQAGIALQNASLFEDLSTSHSQLQQAYDSTLEGWAKALELRDNVTEGHTQRVTKLTVELAKFMGYDEAEIENVRRGAILHDIGKMALPDNILHKKDDLTPEEWEEIKQHPQLAVQMLTNIDFLRPALAIPRYHHERWDGAGYPNQLKGEDIPLPARIFAVVDVWDAMTTNRPYRTAMPKDEAVEYIKKETGKHFDPKVVEAFLQMLDSRKANPEG